MYLLILFTTGKELCSMFSSTNPCNGLHLVEINFRNALLERDT